MKTYILIFLLFLNKTICLTGFTLSDVCKNVLGAIKAKDASKSKKLLEKYFFTLNKDEAVWPVVFEDTRKIFHRDFTRDDYVRFQNDLFKLKSLWNDCTIKSTRREDCTREIFDHLHRYMKDFQWTSFGDPSFFRKYYSGLKTTYYALELLMWKTLSEEPLVHTRKELADWYETLFDEYMESARYLVEFKKKVTSERSYDVSVVNVCQIKQFLWQDFEQPACEARWNKNLNDRRKRSIRDLVYRNTNNINSRKQKSTTYNYEELNQNLDNLKYKKKGYIEGFYEISNNHKEDEASSGQDPSKDEIEGETGNEEDESEFYETFKADFSKVDKIGGTTNDFRIIMDGKFTDSAGKKVFRFGRKIADLYNSTKTDTVDELMKIGYDKKQAYTINVMKEIEIYMGNTFEKIEKAGEILLGQIEYLKGKSRLGTT